MNISSETKLYKPFFLFGVIAIVINAFFLVGVFFFEDFWVYEIIFNCLLEPLILSMMYLIISVRKRKWFDLKGIVLVLIIPIVVPMIGFIITFITKLLPMDESFFMSYYNEFSIDLFMLVISACSIIIGLVTIFVVQIILLLLSRFKYKEVDM